MKNQRMALPGRKLTPILNGQYGDEPDPKEFIEVTMLIRRKKQIPEAVAHAGALSPAEFAARHGATAIDFLNVAQFATAHRLKVIEEHAGSRTLKAAGTIADMEKAFGTSFKIKKSGRKVCRDGTGAITLPTNIALVIDGVFGLDNRPAARKRTRQNHAGQQSHAPLDVARVYQIPGGDGSGQTIAIIEPGGGFSPAVVDSYFSSRGIKPPRVCVIPVSGGALTGDHSGADTEVMMDIEAAGAIAPKAAIKVYCAPNTVKGFLDAISKAIHDGPLPTMIFISWGGPGISWSTPAQRAFDEALLDAAALGISVLLHQENSFGVDE